MRAYWIGLGLIGIAAMAPDSLAAEAGKVVPVAMVRGMDVDEATLKVAVERIDKHLLHAPNVVSPVTRRGGDSLLKEAEALAEARPEGAWCIIGIVASDEAAATFGAVVPQKKAGVVNAAALAKGAEGDADLVAKRVSKEVMNAALLLNGLKPCPNPQCALSTSTDVRGVDRKGYGPCPPCLVQYIKKAEGRGAELRPIGQ